MYEMMSCKVAEGFTCFVKSIRCVTTASNSLIQPSLRIVLSQLGPPQAPVRTVTAARATARDPRRHQAPGMRPWRPPQASRRGRIAAAEGGTLTASVRTNERNRRGEIAAPES
jgi:hypothetical protein